MIEIAKPTTEVERDQAVARLVARDKTAKETLILGNMALVKSIAIDFKRRYPYVDVEDLIQEGVIALMRCTNRYNKEKGTFKNYAITAITRALFRESAKMSKNMKELSFDFGNNSASKGSDDENNLDITNLPDRQSLDAFTRVEDRDVLLRNVRQLYDELSDKQKAVFRARYLCEKPRELKEIAKEIGSSENYTLTMNKGIKHKLAQLGHVESRITQQDIDAKVSAIVADENARQTFMKTLPAKQAQIFETRYQPTRRLSLKQTVELLDLPMSSLSGYSYIINTKLKHFALQLLVKEGSIKGGNNKGADTQSDKTNESDKIRIEWQQSR